MQNLGKYKPSVIALVAANVAPLIGTLFFGWSVFAIMAIYWSENVIIGAINVLKMITCAPNPKDIQSTQSADPGRATRVKAAIEKMGERGSNVTAMHHASKLFFVPFFIVHFGMFCLVHGVFVLTLFGNEGNRGSVMPFGPGMEIEQLAGRILGRSLAPAVLALAASHLFSYFKNYLAGGEFRRTVVPLLMFQPYARVVVMHVAILLGGFATMALGSSVFALLILIVGKTVMDVNLHLREHRRFAETDAFK